MAEFDQESDIIFLYNNSSYNNYEDYESGSENENEEQVLSIGKEFDSWKKVNRFFDEYALSKVYNTIYKSIDEEIQNYLLPNMHNKVRIQISESFLYTAQQFDGNLEEYINLQGKIDNTTEGYLEEMYKKPQINLKTLLEYVEQQYITSLWIIRPMVSNWNHHILILNDRSFLCTCFTIINFGIPSRHFFCLMRYTSNAQFAMALINRKWFNDDKVFDSTIDISITKSISIVQEESYIDNPITLKCQILSTLRGQLIDTELVKKLSKQKQQFIEGHECVTKALNLAIKTDSVDELIGLCNRFMSSHIHLNIQQTNRTYQNDPNYIPNPIVYKVCGHPPKRLKSAVEISRNKRPFKEFTNINQTDEQNAETSATAAEVILYCG
ncbi:hypothetical protein RhiirC2_816698 [Rhizophagus irregularis]|uniref:Uncharacterized protein n=1 Tax=Rhizophagus irregularis TaxID=588596 RepID=A0A2N1MIJ4_9GLOM|nr:hypothetical protein RhiirC2_816698 [Rhizophagus irregularis]